MYLNSQNNSMEPIHFGKKIRTLNGAEQTYNRAITLFSGIKTDSVSITKQTQKKERNKFFEKAAQAYKLFFRSSDANKRLGNGDGFMVVDAEYAAKEVEEVLGNLYKKEHIKTPQKIKKQMWEIRSKAD